MRPHTEYAVQPFRGDYSAIPLRPCRAMMLTDDHPLWPTVQSFIDSGQCSPFEKWLLVWTPDDDIPALHRAKQVHVLGEWDHLVPNTGEFQNWPLTWRQLSAHLFGEVLRHNSLVQRLDRIGIHRAAEPYLITPDTPSAFYRNLTLNYEELDKLLTKAGL